MTQRKSLKPRLLVVDDDPLFDGLVVDHLSELDEYDVLSARSGDQALKILQQAAVDVLITDIKMPNTDGFALVTEARRAYPGLSVIVISGFGRPRWLSQNDRRNGIQFLEKPLHFGKLKKLLRKAVYEAHPQPVNGASPEDQVDATMLAGHSAQYPILDMIQICCIAERTGCVTLGRGGIEGRIYLDQGEIVHAEKLDLSGPAAFCDLAAWDDADFSFENEVSAPTRTIFKSWESMVYEGIQKRGQRLAA